MSATEEYVQILQELKPGDLGLLRQHAGRGLDESVDGFDLFAGLWWPLREKNQRAPRRSVAWLVAKLYALRPLEHAPERTLARQLARCRQGYDLASDPVAKRFDHLLVLSLSQTEPLLQWALDEIASKDSKLDWVQLVDDLSVWERDTTRLKWAEEFLRGTT